MYPTMRAIKPICLQMCILCWIFGSATTTETVIREESQEECSLHVLATVKHGDVTLQTRMKEDCSLCTEDIAMIHTNFIFLGSPCCGGYI